MDRGQTTKNPTMDRGRTIYSSENIGNFEIKILRSSSVKTKISHLSSVKTKISRLPSVKTKIYVRSWWKLKSLSNSKLFIWKYWKFWN